MTALNRHAESTQLDLRARAPAAWFRPSDADAVLVYALALSALGGVQALVWASSDAAQQAYRSRALFEINAGELLALLAIFSVVKAKGEPLVLRKLDFLVLAACAMFFLPPAPSHLPFVGATIAGIYLWRRRPYIARLASVGQILLAVAAYEIWGRLLFRIISEPVIAAEVALIAKAGQLLGFGLQQDGILLSSPGGWSVFMMDGCSSFHNVSLAVLIWLSLLKLAGAEVSRGKLAALGVGILAIVGLNAARILLMTPSEAGYLFWHQGDGATLFSCLTLAAVAVPTIISLRQHG